MTTAEVMPIAVVVAATGCAAITDIRSFKVYHVLTLPLLLSGVLFRVAMEGAWGLGDSLAGAAFGLVALLPFYMAGGMGAGDVKLMAGVGAWLGIPVTIYVLLAASLGAGFYALALIVLRHGLLEGVAYMHVTWLRLATAGRRFGRESTIRDEVKRDDRRRRLIPFAAMIFAGCCASLIWLHLGSASR